MRTIKFRGKRIDNGEWVYGHYFISPLTDENSGTDPKDGWYFLAGKIRHCISTNMGIGGVVYVVDPDTIGQFTGLTDKNGRDIYEGDKLRVVDPNGDEIQDNYIVEWDDNACTYVFEADFGDYDCTSLGCGMQMEYEFEIISNIYDNPELLNP